MRGDTRDLIQRYIYWFGVWEPNITKCILSRLGKGDTFIDIGANVGYYSLLAATHGARVVAIEASPIIHRRLKKNIETNPRLQSSIRTIQCAVTNEVKDLLLYHAYESNTGASTLHPSNPSSHAGVLVSGCALPALLTQREIARTTVMKIDVEGAELEVVEGMTSLLQKLPNEAVIIMEVAQAKPDRQRIFEILRDHGFSAAPLENSYLPETYLHTRKPFTPITCPRRGDTTDSDYLFSRGGGSEKCAALSTVPPLAAKEGCTSIATPSKQ